MLRQLFKFFLLLPIGLLLWACLKADMDSDDIVTETSIVATQDDMVPATFTAPDLACVSFSKKVTFGDGYLLLANLPELGEPTVVNMRTFETQNLTNWSYVRILPNGSAIRYLDKATYTWKVVFSTGILFEKNAELVPYIYIANDHIIAFRNKDEPETGISFYDLDTSKTKQMNIDFPDFHPYRREFVNEWDTVPMFNSSLTFAVYPTFDGMNLIRTSDKTMVAKIPLSPHLYLPQWSPTGESFIFSAPMGGNDLQRLHTDGHVELLTNFGEQYPNSYFESYQWSPDGRLIASWFVNDLQISGKSRHLAITNILSGRTTITCTIFQNQELPVNNRIVWSPDSKYLAIGTSTSENSPSSVYVLDVHNLSYFVLKNSENFNPLGWLLFNPTDE